MIGFVSALSSSLAVIILIMAVMMMNMLKSAQDDLEAQDQEASFQLTADMKESLSLEDNVNTDEGDGGSGTVELNPNIVTDEVKKRLQAKSQVSVVVPYCTYGKNFDYSVASKYTTFNVIVLSRSLPNIDVRSKKPVLDEINDNRCYIDYE